MVVVFMISMSVLIPLCSCGISLPACLSSIQYKAVHSILLVEPSFWRVQEYTEVGSFQGTHSLISEIFLLGRRDIANRIELLRLQARMSIYRHTDWFCNYSIVVEGRYSTFLESIFFKLVSPSIHFTLKILHLLPQLANQPALSTEEVVSV